MSEIWRKINTSLQLLAHRPMVYAIYMVYMINMINMIYHFHQVCLTFLARIPLPSCPDAPYHNDAFSLLMGDHDADFL